MVLSVLGLEKMLRFSSLQRLAATGRGGQAVTAQLSAPPGPGSLTQNFPPEQRERGGGDPGPGQGPDITVTTLG